MNIFLAESLFFFMLIFILGACIGSFINVLIYRLPLMMFRDWHHQCNEFLREHPTPPNIDAKFNIAYPNSHCPNCKQPVKPWHNIPIFSFIFLRGKCHTCHNPLSKRYPFVEALTALLILSVVLQFGVTWLSVLLCIFTSLLVTLTFIDFEHQLLPDHLTLSLLWLGLIINALGMITDAQSAILGATLGYTSLWIIGFSFLKITGKEGMGYGDYKLYAAIGAWLGWQNLIPVILFASLIGIIFTVLMMLCRKLKFQQPFAFGPYLAIAAWVVMMWGRPLQDFYWNMIT